jgi:shikimate kinase
VGRPLLSGDDPLDRWQSIQEQRLPVYRDLARCRVDAASGTPADVARTIHDQLTSEETA